MAFPLPARDFSLSPAGFFQRRVARDGNEGVQLWIQPLNAFQTCACEFNRRYFLFLDSTAGRAQIKQGQFARGAIQRRRLGNSENIIEDRGVTWLISQASNVLL